MRERVFLCFLLTLLLAACSTLQPAAIPPQAQTSAEELAPPASVGRFQLQPGQVAIPPALRNHTLPVYPPGLVHAGAKPITVVARIIIGRDGHVTRVQPMAKHQTSAHYAQFATAVRNAVLQWRFYPLRVQTPKPDGTVAQVSVPVTLWYAFRFSVTHGKPSVQAGRK